MFETKFEELYDSISAAHLLGIGTDRLRELARCGAIPCSKRGRRFIFTLSQLNDYRQGRPYVPKSKK